MNSTPLNDHDLLITLNSKVESLTTEVKSWNDGTKTSLLDHELRIRRLEVATAMAAGGLFILQVLFKFVLK